MDIRAISVPNKVTITIPVAATVSCVAIVAWFTIVALRVFDFSNPAAAVAFHTNVAHLVEIATRVPRNALAVLQSLIFLLSGAGVGDLLCSKLGARFRSGFSRLSAALCVGLICWTALIIVVGAAFLLREPILWSVLAIGVVSALIRFWVTRSQWSFRDDLRLPADRWVRALAIAALGILLVSLYFSLLGALVPEVQFDARFYHLAEARRYAIHGGIYNLAVSQGTPGLAFPQNQELLYAGAFKLFGMAGAKTLSWVNLLLATLAICGFAVEIFGSLSVGAVSAAVFAATPIVAWSGATAGNDLTLASFTVLAVQAVLRWKDDRRATGWCILAGILSGYSFGVKPFAAANIIALCVLVCTIAFFSSIRQLRLRTSVTACALFLGAVLVGALPSVIRTTVMSGDPLFPIGATLLHSPLWSPQADLLAHNSYRAYGADTSFAMILKFPWSLSVSVGEYRDVIGPLFLFALPIVLVCTCKREAPAFFRQATSYLAIWSLLWITSGAIEARYAEAVFPIFCLLVGYLCVGTGAPLHPAARRAFVALVFLGSLLNLQPFVPFQRNALQPQVMGRIPFIWDYLYGDEPEDLVQLSEVPMVQWANDHLRHGADKIYTATQDILFNAYSDIDLYDGFTPWGSVVRSWSLTSPDAYGRLSAAGVTYVLIYKNQQGSIMASPLWTHLAKVRETLPVPGIGDGQGEVLFRLR